MHYAALKPEPRLTHIGWRETTLPLDLPDSFLLARVIAQHRAGYQLHDGEHAFNAQPAPHFLKHDLDPAQRPAVGDFVLFLPGKSPLIEQIVPRRSELSRAAAGERYQRQVIATNVDYVLVLTGLDGDFNPARIERYLLLIQGSGAEPVVVLTKADTTVDATAAIATVRQRVPSHIQVLAVNAKSTTSVASLLAYLKPGDTAVLVGSSGAGKSTLTNTLLGESRQSTNTVRNHDSRGRHTTTHRALIQLPSGGCLIDTPGMREIKLTGSEDLKDDQFTDIETLALKCRFADCAHQREPGCTVQTAITNGVLDPARWQSYLKLRGELATAAEALEAQLKRKAQTRGAKKLRR